MRKISAIILAASAALSFSGAAAQLTGDPKRGGQAYRQCIACHALQPDVHTTGPSLAELWGRKAGTAKDFLRYSKQLRAADITWDENTLNAWLADPATMVPGTFMVFRGIEKDQVRADLIAFLRIAMASGGAADVVKKGIVPADYTQGQVPEPLKSLPPEVQVKHVRHCGDSYFVTTGDGRETPYWEMNVRLKLDTRTTGPEADTPMIVRAGMFGDRVSIIFSRLDEIPRFVIEKC